MKLNNNHKIILGLAVGGGIAWWLTRKKSATTSNTPAITNANAEDLSREDKIAYIVENIEANDTEVSTGFSGERFQYDARLGYSLPSGTVRTQSAGGEMVLPREGNLAQEVFFNADGEETDNPVEEAEAILDGLTARELNVAFRIARMRAKNRKLTDDEIIKIAKLDEDGKKLFRGIIREKLNDVKALSKSRNWKKGVIRKMKQRKAMQGMSKDQRIAYRSEIQAERKAKRERRNDRKDKRQERKEARGTGGFADEVTNRQSGAMWGGYRNDGLPTNADARRPMTRRIKYNERRS